MMIMTLMNIDASVVWGFVSVWVFWKSPGVRLLVHKALV
jgi:hypothetical protein